MTVPFVDLKAQYLSIKPAIDAAISHVIEETAFIGGKYVKDFEEAFARDYGVKHCISCGNGTDSLYILMKMMGIGAGDEVVTAANSWISSSETITQTGAKAVFADVDAAYYTITLETLQKVVTPATKAVILVHLFGQMAEVVEIKSFCDSKGIFLIEDCAQSHYSEAGGTRAGLSGIAGSFSFYPGKNLGAYGDAGCIITNDDALAEKCKMFARHGALIKHQHQMEGINSRLDGLQAAILSAKLPHIHEWTQKRIDRAALYTSLLTDIKQVQCPTVRPNTKHSFHLYVIRVKDRQSLIESLRVMGIETAIHYPTALPLLLAYSYLRKGEQDFPVAAQMQNEILSLPLYPELTEEQVHHVVSSVKKHYEKA